MDQLTKRRVAGIICILPMIILILYLIVSPKMWLVAIMNGIFTLLAMYGMHLYKGFSSSEAIKDVVEDLIDKNDKPKE